MCSSTTRRRPSSRWCATRRRRCDGWRAPDDEDEDQDDDEDGQKMSVGTSTGTNANTNANANANASTTPNVAVRFGRMVKFEHTIFALPFALAAAAIAARGHGLSIARLAGIVVAMAAARTAAMGFNRIADR